MGTVAAMSQTAELDEADRPHTYLVWGFFAAMLCFLPLGLVALYYGLRTSKAIAEGDGDEAAHLSRVAKRWVIATIAVGIVVYLIIAAALMLLGAFSK